MKLYYFNIYGKGEPIRILFHIAKVSYQDVRIEFKDWPKLKTDNEMFEYGQMPVLEKDGKLYTQSNAILKMLGKEYSLYPTDTYEQYLVDNCLDSISDFSSSLWKVSQQSKDKKEEEFHTFMKNVANPSFRVWQKRIQNKTSQEFFVGKKLSIADICLVNLYANKFIKGPFNDSFKESLDCHPMLAEYFGKRYEDLNDYFSKRPDCPF